MNDFTKEELLWFYNELEHITQDYSYVDKEAYSIQEKIKSMIDNYCEHDYKTIDNDFIVKHIEVCTKCGKSDK